MSQPLDDVDHAEVAYQQGYDAPPDHPNPYPAGSVMAAAWQEGRDWGVVDRTEGES